MGSLLLFLAEPREAIREMIPLPFPKCRDSQHLSAFTPSHVVFVNHNLRVIARVGQRLLGVTCLGGRV